MKKTAINTFLSDKTIGISISESSDLTKLGFGISHLEDAKLEIARHLLSSGAVLLYGGDLRENGFTRNLFELVESQVPSAYYNERLSLVNYLGWPLDSTLKDSLRASLSGKINFVLPGLPEDLSGSYRPSIYLPPTTEKHFYMWSRSMSYMRSIMTSENDVRISLGGKVIGFKGKYPGIVEEVYLSIKSEKPTFLIGAYGGATQVVIDAIQGKQPLELTNEYHSSDVLKQNSIEYYNRHKPDNQEKLDYNKLTEYFNSKGISSLKNGLTDEENKVLFKTIHIPEMVSLILKGLATLYK
jgi:hypothetical protein